MKHHPQPGLLLAVIFLTLGQGPLSLWALEDFTTHAPRILRLPISLPEVSSMTAWVGDGQGNYTRRDNVSRLSREDQTWRLDTVAPESTSYYRFDHNWTLVEYDMVRSPASKGMDDSPPIPHTHFRLGEHHTYHWETWNNDGSSKKEEYRMGGKDILFVYLPYVLQRCIKAGLTKGINFDCVISAAIRQNFDARFIPGGDFRAHAGQFKYPQEVAQRLASLPLSWMAEVGLTGLPSVIFPHKFYLAYGPGPTHFLLGFWGGEPGKEFYQLSNPDALVTQGS